MKLSRSFASRLSLNLIGTTAILFILANLFIAAVSYISIYKAATKDAQTNLELNFQEIEKMLTDVEATTNSSVWLLEKFHDSDSILIDIAEHLILTDTNIVSCSIGFEPFEYRNDEQYFCPFAYFDENGQTHTRIMGSDDYDYHLMDWYLIPKLLGKPYWSEPALDSDGSGRLVASYSIPLYNLYGLFFGVIKTDIDLQWLTDKVQSIRPYENSYTILAGRNAAYISHPDKSKILTETLYSTSFQNKDKNLRKLADDMVAGKEGVVRIEFGKIRGVAVYGPLQNGWSGASVCTYDDIFNEATKSLLIALLVAVLGLIGLYFSNKRLITRSAQPITEIAYAALNIGQGNFKAKIPSTENDDELRRLSDSLKYMENTINNYISELRTTTASNERYESELNIASAIQMQMLPKDFPQLEEVDLHAALYPAKEVGGDLYDFFVKDRTLYFAVGDVSGKGVPAALYMAITRSAFRFIAGLGLPVEGVVTKINNAFCDGNDSGMFVTMFVGRINLDTLELQYCNAGHNPILIVDKDGSTHYLHAKPNIAAGLFEDFPYQGETLQLEKGHRLLIYTDGVSEAENRVKNLYGEDRLEQFARNESLTESSEGFLKNLIASVRSFTGDNPQNDDITVMAIKL